MGRSDIDVEYNGSNGHRRSNSKGVHPIGPYHPPPQGVALMPGERKMVPFLIPIFVVANVVVFIITMYVNDCPKNSSSDRCILRWLRRFSFQPFSENPLLGPSSKTLQKMGGLEAMLVTKDNQGWRLVTCTWLHAGVFHLLANMLGLLLIGIRLEQEFGFLKVGLVYLISGLGGSLMSALFIENEISVGASGALFGLLGATLSELITNWTIYANKCIALSTLVLIVIVNLAFGLMPHVDNFAHIGGFLSGFLLGFVFLVKPQYGWVNLRDLPPGYRDTDMPVKSKHTVYQYLYWIVGAILLVMGYTAAFVALFTGVDVNKRCSWCHYLSCVPTSKWRCDNS